MLPFVTEDVAIQQKMQQTISKRCGTVGWVLGEDLGVAEVYINKEKR